MQKCINISDISEILIVTHTPTHTHTHTYMYILASCTVPHIIRGRNEMGQLGNGTREYKEKLRFTTGFSHRIIQVSAGCSHVVALTREGNVIAWGGNRKGQLGDGQFTSSCEAKVILQLRHRPVVLITCGEEHSLALTSGGNVYSWGDNSQGQLGLGDCKVGKAEYLYR